MRASEERQRFVEHGHYNNGRRIICPIPLRPGISLGGRQTLAHEHGGMKGGNLSVCVSERAGRVKEGMREEGGGGGAVIDGGTRSVCV